jgi:hypothetical protein
MKKQPKRQRSGDLSVNQVSHPKLLLCMLLWKQRKEPPMDHGQLSMVADKFQWVFSEALLNACGTAAKFCRRMRTITPFRLGLALTATCARQRVETLADFHRGFNALFDTTITYKAFYTLLSAELIREEGDIRQGIR